jgi:hypothetical protein
MIAGAATTNMFSKRIRTLGYPGLNNVAAEFRVALQADFV